MTNSRDDIVVLVADDEPSTLALVASHVRTKGYKVLEASDGDQAWQLAYEHLPDLVVLDVMMPGMSGWEVCRKIREAVSLAHTGVVMLTGIGENLNEMTSPLYGADTYIDKPFEFTELDAKIRETLERRRQGAMGRPDGADAQTPKRASSVPPAGSGSISMSDRTTPVDDRPTAPSAKASAVAAPKAPTQKPKAKAAPKKKAAVKKAPAKAKKKALAKAKKKAPVKAKKKALAKAKKKAPAKKTAKAKKKPGRRA